MAEISREWVGLIKSLVVLTRNQSVDIPGVGRAYTYRKHGRLYLKVEIDHTERSIEEAIDER